MLEIVFGEASDLGKVRTNNEDATGCHIPVSKHEVRSRGYLFAVADGVGGADLGEVAAATAVQVVTREFAESQDGTLLRALMPRLVQSANAAVHDCRLQPEYRGTGMATTLVTCALRYNQAVVSHLGDSRCYLLRHGELRQITRDHSLANQRRMLGLLRSADSGDPTNRHALTKCLGPEMFVKPETNVFDLVPGDIVMLCTDGLHNALTEREAIGLLSQPGKDAETLARELVAFAVDKDGDDNTTAQVIRIESVESATTYRGREFPVSH